MGYPKRYSPQAGLTQAGSARHKPGAPATGRPDRPGRWRSRLVSATAPAPSISHSILFSDALYRKLVPQQNEFSGSLSVDFPPTNFLALSASTLREQAPYQMENTTREKIT